MLSLEPHHRDALLQSGSLTKNDDGREILRGLTRLESVFVLDFEAGGMIDSGLCEVMIYNQLVVRHSAAKVLHKAAYVRP